MDDGGVHDRAGGDLQSVLLKMEMHFFEDARAQIVLFKQMAEAADRGLVRRRLAAKIDADELRAWSPNRRAPLPPPGRTD